MFFPSPSTKIHLNLLLLFVALHLLFAPASARAADYNIGPDDVLRINVYDHPDLTTKVRVNGNGQILMPLLGHVKVDGFSIEKVSVKLAELLADGYIVNPQVNVFVEEYGSKKAVILGRVKQPGLYELSGQTTLLELISKAGGQTDDAGSTATIKRLAPDGRTTILTVDLGALMKGGDISQNLPINHKDNVYIAKAGMCYVTGEVAQPDAYKIDEDTTIIKAITLAGGFSGKAAKGGVRIIRIVNGGKTVLKDVNLDTPVLPDDVIVIPESFF